MRLGSLPIRLLFHGVELLQIFTRMPGLTIMLRIDRLLHSWHGLEVERDWTHLLWSLHC